MAKLRKYEEGLGNEFHSCPSRQSGIAPIREYKENYSPAAKWCLPQMNTDGAFASAKK
jgi:hypothetical protein